MFDPEERNSKLWPPALSVAAVLEQAPEHEGPVVQIEFFTDPLSGWCWGNQPDWLRLCESFGSFLRVRIRMVGLLKDRAEGMGGPGALSDPSRMAMQWEEIQHLTGMPMHSDRWLESAPGSSWPACAAVAGCLREKVSAGERLLRRLREAALVLDEDLESAEALCGFAEEAGLSGARLGEMLASGEAARAFEEDLQAAAALGGVSAPSFRFQGAGGTVTVRGSRPFRALIEALTEAHGDALPLVCDPADLPDRQAYACALAEARGSMTAAELAALLEIERSDAKDLLDRTCAGGSLQRIRKPWGTLYRPQSWQP